MEFFERMSFPCWRRAVPIIMVRVSNLEFELYLSTLIGGTGAFILDDVGDNIILLLVIVLEMDSLHNLFNL